MAETLKEGQPCPVCGALNHPKKACKSEAAPTKEQLDRLKTDLEIADKAANDASAEAGKKNAVFCEKKAAAEAKAKQILGVEEFEKIASALKTAIAENGEKSREIAARIAAAQEKIKQKTPRKSRLKKTKEI